MIKHYNEYAAIANKRETLNESLVAMAKELESHANMGLQKEENVLNTLASFSDCYEIIEWYLYFVMAKLRRALHGKLDDDDLGDEFPKDSVGSAKIAIISIESTMGA